MARLFALAALALLAACGGDRASDDPSSPTGPTPPASLTGTYAGTVSDASGPGRLTWRLTQSNADVSGTFTARDDVSGITADGSVTGTVSGSSLTFRMTAGAGTLPPPFASCSLDLNGTAQVTAAAIDGTYTGRNSCTGPFANGRLSLTKQ
jgi:hypothetical protein